MAGCCCCCCKRLRDVLWFTFKLNMRLNYQKCNAFIEFFICLFLANHNDIVSPWIVVFLCAPSSSPSNDELFFSFEHIVLNQTRSSKYIAKRNEKFEADVTITVYIMHNFSDSILAHTERYWPVSVCLREYTKRLRLSFFARDHLLVSHN